MASESTGITDLSHCTRHINHTFLWVFEFQPKRNNLIFEGWLHTNICTQIKMFVDCTTRGRLPVWLSGWKYQEFGICALGKMQANYNRIDQRRSQKSLVILTRQHICWFLQLSLYNARCIYPCATRSVRNCTGSHLLAGREQFYFLALHVYVKLKQRVRRTGKYRSRSLKKKLHTFEEKVELKMQLRAVFGWTQGSLVM